MIAQQVAEFVLATPGGLLRERTIGGKILWSVPLLPFVLPALWSWFRIVQRVCQRRWRERGWYGRVLWTATYTAACLSFWASEQRGLTPNSQEASCRYAGQSFDSDYFYSHFGPLPPLLNSSPCNDHYDLVAGWINPTIVVCLILAVAALAALTWSTYAESPVAHPSGRRPPSRPHFSHDPVLTTDKEPDCRLEM